MIELYGVTPSNLNNNLRLLTAGISKKLVTIFASHLDSFIVKPNLSALNQIRKTGSGQFLEPGQIYRSPGLQKLRHGVLPAGIDYRLKNLVPIAISDFIEYFRFIKQRFMYLYMNDIPIYLLIKKMAEFSEFFYWIAY